MTQQVASPLRVFWQPGCTSCLATKQFLASQGIAFESINVREHPQAMQWLAALGARSVPVVARGQHWVYAQERADVVAFLGLQPQSVASVHSLTRLELTQRIDALLRATEQLANELPAALWEQGIAGRDDRTVLDLPFHIAQIVDGLLDAVTGGELTYEHFERRPAGPERTAPKVAAQLRRVRERFRSITASDAMDGAATANDTRSLRTYYGEQPLLRVLERSAWHAAQHARQLEHLLVAQGVQPSSPLSDRELAGLPLPAGVWDAEAGKVD